MGGKESSSPSTKVPFSFTLARESSDAPEGVNSSGTVVLSAPNQVLLISASLPSFFISTRILCTSSRSVSSPLRKPITYSSSENASSKILYSLLFALLQPLSSAAVINTAVITAKTRFICSSLRLLSIR